MRVLPPPGTLIWRLPGFIRPRCTAGATHRLAESYQGVEAHGKRIADSLAGLNLIRHLRVVTVTAKDREPGILGEAGIGVGKIAEDEERASRGLDPPGMKTIHTKTGTRGVWRLLLRIRHENKDSAVPGRGDC